MKYNSSSKVVSHECYLMKRSFTWFQFHFYLECLEKLNVLRFVGQ